MTVRPTALLRGTVVSTGGGTVVLDVDGNQLTAVLLDGQVAAVGDVMVALHEGRRLVAFSAPPPPPNPCLPPDIVGIWPQTNVGDTLLVTGLWTPGGAGGGLTITTPSGSSGLIPVGGIAATAVVANNNQFGAGVWWYDAPGLAAGEWTATLSGSPTHTSIRVLRDVNSGAQSGEFATADIGVGPWDPPTASGTYEPPNMNYCTYGFTLNARVESITVPGMYAHTSGTTPNGTPVYAGAFSVRRGQAIPWGIEGRPDVSQDFAYIYIGQLTRTL